jgi:hypothetical protein
MPRDRCPRTVPYGCRAVPRTVGAVPCTIGDPF